MTFSEKDPEIGKGIGFEKGFSLSRFCLFLQKISLKRILFYSGVVVIIFYVIWAGPFIDTLSRTEFDPDSIYHKIRIRECIKSFPYVNSYDVKSHFPEGNTIHWPNSYTLFLASLQKVFGQQVLDWVPVLGGLICWSLIFWFLYTKNLIDWTVIATFFFIVVAPEASFNFIFGTIDHHWAMQLSFALMLLSLLGGSYKFSLWGMAIGFFSSPESIFFVSLFLALWTFRQICVRKLGDKRNSFLLFSPFLFSLISYLIHFVLKTDTLEFWNFSLKFESMFQPVWFLFIGLLAWIFLQGLPFFEDISFSKINGKVFFQKQRFLFFSAGVFLLGFGVFSFIYFFDGALYLNRFFSLDRLKVAEEVNPFFFPSFLKSALHYKIYFFLILGLGLVTQKRLIRRIDAAIFFILLCIAMRELRYLRIMSPLVPLLLGFTLPRLNGILKDSSLSMGFRGFLTLSSIGVYSMGLIQLAPTRFDVQTHRGEDKLKIIEEIKKWSMERKSEENEKQGGILASWSYGHHIHFFLDQGVTVDPFNFPTPISDVLKDIYLVENSENEKSKLEKYQVEYIMLFWPSNDFFSIAPRLEYSPRVLKWGTKNLTIFNEDVLRFPLNRARVDFNCFNFELGFRSVYSSQEMRIRPVEINRDSFSLKNVPLVRVYKKNTAAIVRGVLPVAVDSTFLEIEYQVINTNTGETELLKYLVEAEEDSSFCFEVSHEAPGEFNGFSIGTGYFLIVEGFTTYLEVKGQGNQVTVEVENWFPDSTLSQ